VVFGDGVEMQVFEVSEPGYAGPVVAGECSEGGGAAVVG